eukprot:COSAG01_NODE_2183_length_8208_cov_4.918486_5_plen_59_part_00
MVNPAVVDGGGVGGGGGGKQRAAGIGQQQQRHFLSLTTPCKTHAQYCWRAHQELSDCV